MRTDTMLRNLCIWLICCFSSLCAPAGATTLSLDGDWQFLADPSGAFTVQQLTPAQFVRAARVPSSWQSQFADLRDYAGVAWYWRDVNLPFPPPGQVALLRFGAVDYRAEVYVNGQKVGAHEGGYTPFEFDITSLLRSGANRIAVRVVDPGANPRVVEGIDYAEIPHGKQSWYVQTSGLWQSVEVQIRPRNRLGAVHISAGANGTFKISVPVIKGASPAPTSGATKVSVEMRDSAGKAVWQASKQIGDAEVSAEFTGLLANPRLWSPANPVLYTLHASLTSGDSADFPFGFRTFESRGGKFYLNGQAIYLRGALDQDFYPDTIYTPPSLDYIKEEMRKARALGLNLLRCHIKVPDPRYLEAADESGILIWYEIPNWDKLTDNSKRRALETLQGMVERDWNHPCLVIVSLINESWGINLKEAEERQWLKQTYEEAKKLVPGWLVDDNSACYDNYHVATDIADFHTYSAIPDRAEDFDHFVADLAQRPSWLFSPYGDAAPRGDEPLVLSEFGNWGLPRIPREKPWWFARHGDNDVVLPEGIEQRYAEYRYPAVFPTLEALTEASEWHEYVSLKYEIESIRSHPEIQGYVITEFTDLNWESNGLLDMWRNPKAFAGALAEIQGDEMLTLRAEKRNYAPNGTITVTVSPSNYGLQALDGGRIAWQVEGTPLAGTILLPSLPAASVGPANKIQFAAPAAPTARRRELKLQLVWNGKTVAENSLPFYVYPDRQPDLPPPVAFYDPNGKLRRLVNAMRLRSYLAPGGSEAAMPVVIASTFDDEVKKKLQAGGRVILLSSEHATLAPGLEIVPRAGSIYEGNWISDFLWVRKAQPPFSAVGFDTMPGFETQALTIPAVVQGIAAKDFGDVLAGMFFGWIHSNVGVLVQAKYGKGTLLICTMSVDTIYGTDPYATDLLDALVTYLVSGSMPKLEIP